MPQKDYEWWPAEKLPDVVDIWLEFQSYVDLSFRFQLHIQTAGRNTHSRNKAIADIVRATAIEKATLILSVLEPFVEEGRKVLYIDLGFYTNGDLYGS